MPTRRVGARTVAWREAGAGAPALMLHCALAHSGAFAGIMERLADRLATRALDLPGHGDTEEDRALDPQDQTVADALALLADRASGLLP